MIQEKLARRLLYLPLDLHEKVLLWLAYRGLKPVSEITVERRNMALLRKGIRTSPPNIKNKINRIRKWIHDAGLFYATEPGYASSWHIGRNKDQVKLSAKILRRFDYENEYRSGTLFGFPKESAKAYARNRILKLGENPIPMARPFEASHFFLKDRYYTPYLFYSVRADRVKADSQIVKLWADTVRKDVPTLAKWFEKYQAENRKRESKWDNKWKLRAKRDNQSGLQVISEYSRETNTAKGLLLKALQEFSDNLLGDFQISAICNELRKRITPSEKKDKDLTKVLKVGEHIYEQGRKVDIMAKRKRVKKLHDWLNKNK